MCINGNKSEEQSARTTKMDVRKCLRTPNRVFAIVILCGWGIGHTAALNINIDNEQTI